MTSIESRQEIEGLRKQLADAHAAIADRDATIAKLAANVATLQAAVKQLLRHRGRDHGLQEGQGLLFPEAVMTIESAQEDAGEHVAEEVDDGSRPPRSERGRKRTPGKIDTTGLPHEDRVHDVPEAQRVDPVTGKQLVQIGEKVFEELDYKRAQLIVIHHRRPIYGLPPEEAEHREIAPVVADLPPRALENCVASAMLIAWLLVQKYANHLPLYRQEEIFGRDGKRLPRQTLCDWALAAAEALRPISDCLMAQIRAGPVMQLDDTPVMCQGGRGEPNFQACLWTFVNPEVSGVAYRFTPGRASEPLAVEIGNFQGTLVGDGYSGNRAAADKAVAANGAVGAGIVSAGCWAHSVRKFRDAAAEAPGTAKLFRDDIQKLYEIEREADEAALEPQARAALRQQKAKPVLIEIYSRARRVSGQFSDTGDMAKAIKYLRTQYRPLRRFLEDGHVPIDNNACERAIRPIAIGRRNWLFAGSMRGGRAAAVIYTLVECCRLAKVDMVSYLADVMVRVATHPSSRLEQLLPAKWATTFGPQPAEPALA